MNNRHERRAHAAQNRSRVSRWMAGQPGLIEVDGGYDAACAVVQKCYGDVLARADPASLGKDPKTRLQEWLQGRGHALPAYTVLEVSGEPHEQRFRVRCDVPDLAIMAVADGSSRRRAEHRELDRLDHCWSRHETLEASREHCGMGVATTSPDPDIVPP